MRKCVARGALCVAAVAFSAGCAGGTRPYFATEEPVTDPAIDAVLSRLATAGDANFTARYTIVTKFGDRMTTATVAQDGQRRSITIGDIRFLVTSSSSLTCELDTGVCTEGLRDAMVSDVQVTNEFWGRAMENRLRTDAGRNIAPATASDYPVDGLTAVCAAVPVVGGVKSYCALDSGVLAGYDGADLTIELTAYSDTVDATLFSRAEL